MLYPNTQTHTHTNTPSKSTHPWKLGKLSTLRSFATKMRKKKFVKLCHSKIIAEITVQFLFSDFFSLDFHWIYHVLWCLVIFWIFWSISSILGHNTHWTQHTQLKKNHRNHHRDVKYANYWQIYKGTELNKTTNLNVYINNVILI